MLGDYILLTLNWMCTVTNALIHLKLSQFSFPVDKQEATNMICQPAGKKS